MKKFLIIILTLAVTVSIEAAQVLVKLVDGTTQSGNVIKYDEEQLVIEPNTFVKYSKKYLPNDVVSFEIEGVGRFYSKEGKFVFDESSQAISQTQTSGEQVAPLFNNNVGPATPNVVIGNALKKTGGVCMGIGISSAIVGAILVGVGNSGTDVSGKSTTEILQIAKTKANRAAAGYVLLPMGAALTIVGIPLNVHGKRIAEMNINYTGNGAGISMNF